MCARHRARQSAIKNWQLRCSGLRCSRGFECVQVERRAFGLFVGFLKILMAPLGAFGIISNLRGRDVCF
jgi:hypothetical protein